MSEEKKEKRKVWQAVHVTAEVLEDKLNELGEDGYQIKDVYKHDGNIWLIIAFDPALVMQASQKALFGAMQGMAAGMPGMGGIPGG